MVVRPIQQHLTKDEVFWVPTHLQWSDALTKLGDKVLETFMSWLRKPWIQLRAHQSQQNTWSVKFAVQDRSHSMSWD